MPAHHKAQEYLDEYIEEAGIKEEKEEPLFRTVNRKRELTGRRMHRVDVSRMVKRRAKDAGLPPKINCHTFRATGITVYLDNDGALEHVQRIAAHEDTVEAIERIRI